MAEEKEKAIDKAQQPQPPTPDPARKAAGELTEEDIEKVAGGSYEPYTSVYSCSGTACTKLK